MKSRIFIVCSIILLAFFSPQKHIVAATGDAFNLSQATITGSSPQDVASWPVTATINSVVLNGPVSVDFDRKNGPNRWPDQTDLPGFIGTNPDGSPSSLQYTLWLFLNINGKWVGSGIIEAWYGRDPITGAPISDATCNWYYDNRWAPMTGYQFKAGEQLGFMVTAGDARNGNTDLKERSNIIVLQSPLDATDPSTCPAGAPNPTPAPGPNPGPGSGGGGNFCPENVIVGGQIRGTSPTFDTTPSGLSLATCLKLCQTNNAEACNYGDGGDGVSTYCESEHSSPGNPLYIYNYPGVNPVPYDGTSFTGWAYVYPQDAPCLISPTSAGVTALSGKNPSLVFDPAKKLWLVVAENGGKIQGQLMTDANKPSGSVLNIGGSGAHTPKVSYSPSLNKYLVVWTSGQDPSAVLWGQLLSEDGSASGTAFKIATGGAHLYSASDIQFDAINQRFVLVYEKAANSVGIMVVGIDGSGTITGPTKLADVSLKGSAPSVAINTKTKEYCATYLDGDKLKIQPVSADGTIGTATELGQAQDNAGIIYNSTDSSYVAAWLNPDGSIDSKTLTTCADDPGQDPISLADGVQTGILVQNTNGFGLFVVNSNKTSDKFTSFDSSDNGGDGQTVFAGTWTANGLWLAAAVNPVTGTYAAAASPDTQDVKFVSGIGTPSTGPVNNGPIPKSTDFPVPSKGLPTDLGQLISAIFVWSLSIIGLVIFVRFFYAGFLWFTAAGGADRVSRAKTIMKNAVYGALVLFSAFIILNTINPDLVGSVVKLPGIPATNPTAGTAPATGSTPKTPTNFCVNYVCSANSPQNPGQPCGSEVDCGGIDPLCKDGYCTDTGTPCTGEAQCASSNTSGAAGTCTNKDDAGNGICSNDQTKTCTTDIECASDSSVNGSGLPSCTNIDDAGNGVCSDNPDQTCTTDSDCGG